jgi:flagellar motor switch protein FliM
VGEVNIMSNEFNQGEIEATLPAFRGGGEAATDDVKPPKVEPWDVRRAGQIGPEQLQSITQLHEGFARSLTHSLGAYLRVVFAASLISAEHVTYREFLGRIPETTYLASCKLDPMGVNGALQLDLKVIFSIVDLLLGGEGKSISTSREITEIEEQIVDSVAGIVCRELATAWQAVDLKAVFERRIAAGEAQQLLLPDEKMLALSFEIVMLEVRGELNLALPVSVSHALLRKMSAERSGRRPRGRSEFRERLKHRLLDCAFSVELGVSGLRAPVEKLSHLEAGQLLPLYRNVTLPGALMVAGVEMFRAIPARSGEMRAAQVIALEDEPHRAEMELS